MRASEAGGGQSLPGLESPGKRLEWAFDKLCEVDALLGAIVATWARYTAANMKPGAERWICDKTEWGPILQADIRREWKARVDADEAVQSAVRAAEAELGADGRVLLRPSGTEPLVRVMVEAVDAAQAQSVAESLAAIVAASLPLSR